jgi:hypothetical protein
LVAAYNFRRLLAWLRFLLLRLIALGPNSPAQVGLKPSSSRTTEADSIDFNTRSNWKPSGAADGVDDVADCVGEVIAVPLLDVADDELDGGTPFELALDLRRDVPRT